MRWFAGIRLSTREQESLALKAKKSKAESYETGDTLILTRDGVVSVYRLDWDCGLEDLK